jgi:RNA recognition motif-containing protein
MKLYVGNLPYNTTESELSDVFAAFGEVESIRIITDRDTGRSKGFGFVELADRAAAEQAMADLNDSELGGRRIKVNEARPRNDNRGGGYGGGGRNYNRY